MKIKTSDWILLPGGKNALLRFPLQGNIEELSTPSTGTYRKATHTEVLAIALSPYPWGYMPENSVPNKLWKDNRIGYGGLVHSAWFVLENGERIGGAPNVPEIGPGALRHYLLTTGGFDQDGLLNENEGYAVVWEGVPSHNEEIYRAIHAHVAQRVSADRGNVIISPTEKPDDVTHVGFVGRCMTCPNPERISIKALKHECPTLFIELNPDWKDWSL